MPVYPCGSFVNGACMHKLAMVRDRRYLTDKTDFQSLVKIAPAIFR